MYSYMMFDLQFGTSSLTGALYPKFPCHCSILRLKLPIITTFAVAHAPHILSNNAKIFITRLIDRKLLGTLKVA